MRGVRSFLMVLVMALAAFVVVSVVVFGAGSEAIGASGKDSYNAICAGCHGADSKGNPAMAQMFQVDPKALDLTVVAKKRGDKELYDAIKNGKGKMPPFGNMSSADIKVLVQHLRSLK